MAVLGMLDEIQGLIGRAQARGSFAGTLNEASVVNNKVVLEVPLKWEATAPQSFSSVSSTTGMGQRHWESNFPSIPSGGLYKIKALRLYGYRNLSYDLRVQLYNATTSTLIGTAIVPYADIPPSGSPGWFDVPVPDGLYHVPGQRLDIRCMVPTTVDGAIALNYNLNNQSGAGNSYYINSGDSGVTWNFPSNQYDLVHSITLESNPLSGTVAVNLDANSVQQWGQLFFLTDGNVTCNIEDKSGNVLISGFTSGGSLAALDPKKELVARFYLSRATASDPTPAVYEPSWTWIGAPEAN